MSFNDKLNALRRSQRDRLIAGVCAGLAEGTDTPTWLWRVGFVFLALFAFGGLLLYLLLWYFMPDSDAIAK